MLNSTKKEETKILDVHQCTINILINDRTLPTRFVFKLVIYLPLELSRTRMIAVEPFLVALLNEFIQFLIPKIAASLTTL